MRKVILAILILVLLGWTGVQSGISAQSSESGKVVVTYENDVATLDPAIGYSWTNWTIIQAMFDGLMGYVPGTTQLEPILAKNYTISPDGLTYTFELRKGIEFQDGTDFTAKDVQYSMLRMLNPKTESPGTSFYGNIKGAPAYIQGKAKDILGIKVLGPYEIQFTLIKPDATFLNKLALNFAFVVPSKEVEKYGKDFGHHPVGTGAFEFKEWLLGRELILVKNPHYFINDEPKVNEIIFQFGVDPNVAFLRYMRGQVDILGNGIPSAQFQKVMTDPKLSKLVAISNQLETSYVTLNTTIKPLNNVDVRQALNMAINRTPILRVINDRGQPAYQILPLEMPGYSENYKGFPYDPKKAKELLAKAGYPNGFNSVLYTSNVSPNPRIAQVIQEQLAQIGVKVQIRSLSPSTVIEAAGAGKAPMVWSGGMAWIDDYPDPNDFYWPILSCKSAVPGGWNWARYCNEKLEKLAGEADEIVQSSQRAKRMALWQKIFTEAMNDAPWIPIFHSQMFILHTARIGGIGLKVVGIDTPVNYKEITIVNGH